MKKILVLEGGFNEEHEISISTSKEIKKSLKRMKYIFSTIKVNPLDFEKKIKNYSNNFICFNALHGTYGEDGKIQKILEKNSFLYTHSNSSASNLAFNKKLTKKVLKGTNIPLIEDIIIKKSQFSEALFKKVFKQYRAFVLKPIASGSSFGVKIFQTNKEVENFFSDFNNQIKLYRNHDIFMIERYIKGRELTVAVYENKKKSEAVAVTEIQSSSKFFDYKAKYTKGFSKHIVPARIQKKEYLDCLSYAKIAHDKIGCKGVSRSDFIYDNNRIYFLEINSQPGLTPISLVPEQLSFKKINFDLLIKKIIESSCV